MTLASAALSTLLALSVACKDARPSSQPHRSATSVPVSARPSGPPEETPEPPPDATPLPAEIAPLLTPFKGDLDGMVKRRIIRVLTVQNPILYFVDRGREVGILHDVTRIFENELNAALGKKTVRMHVVLIPVPRDQLLPRLVAGQGDIAAAALTITPEREKEVDFVPTASGIREVLVTAPGVPKIASLDELAGREVYVRLSSSYAEHLRALNQSFHKRGLPRVTLLPAPEILEDGDILEMVNAGLVARTVVDEFMADLYDQVFPNLEKGAAISEPGQLGWAIRHGSPKLAQAVGKLVKKHGQGTLTGNVILGRYLKTTRWVKNARSEESARRFTEMVDLFKEYSDRYDFDYLLMAAQGYQESGLDQQKCSAVGAIGVMQVMPATARDKAVAIANIDRLENNIHAGIKYNRWVADHFYRDAAMTPLDRQLFALASYNAGPNRVARLRAEAKATGLDPNVWFNNVELVAARRIGRETVVYVSNIYKYYLAYQMMTRIVTARRDARELAAR